MIACKKDKKLSPAELITSNTWKIDTIALDMDGNNEMDTPLLFPLSSCEKDDLITFSSDNTGIYSDGPTKCSEDDPDSTPFEWEFKNDNKILYISGNLNDLLKGDVDIVLLNDNTLTLAKKVDLGGLFPENAKVIGRFKK